MSDADSSPQRQSREIVILVLAALAFLGIGLGSRDLWNPNEPTYGRVVVEMVESGDWLVPRLNGEPFVEKPILYYWMAAATSKLFGGVNEITLRLPVLLLGVLSVLLVYLLIGAYDGTRRARIGAALFATLYSVWFTARNGQMDSFVLITTLAVVYAMVRRLDHGAPAVPSWLLAGIAAGFGFAGKGPVTIVVPGLILGCYVLVARRPWRRLLPGMPVGILALLIVASPWYLALYLNGQTDALRELLLRQNVSRFVSAWDHAQPWWYYLKYFWVTFAPWSWFVPIVAVAAWRQQTGEARSGQRLAWVWILAPLVFFSLSDSKREPYMLPAAPAVAWLAAWLFDEQLRGGLRRWQTNASNAVCATFGTLFLLGGVWSQLPGALRAEQAEQFGAALRVVGAVLILIGALILASLLWRRARRFVPVATWAAFVILLTFVGTWAFAVANPLKSHRPIAAAIEGARPAGSHLYSYFDGYRVVRGGYPYYLGYAVPDLQGEDRLRETWASDSRPCVIYEETRFEELIENLPGATRLYESQVGSRTARLVCAGGPDAGR